MRRSSTTSNILTRSRPFRFFSIHLCRALPLRHLGYSSSGRFQSDQDVMCVIIIISITSVTSLTLRALAGYWTLVAYPSCNRAVRRTARTLGSSAGFCRTHTAAAQTSFRNRYTDALRAIPSLSSWSLRYCLNACCCLSSRSSLSPYLCLRLIACCVRQAQKNPFRSKLDGSADQRLGALTGSSLATTGCPRFA